MGSEQPAVLDYASKGTVDSRPKWAGAIGVLISIPAIAVVFLDFTSWTSPFDVAHDCIVNPDALWRPESRTFILLATPFFLAFVLFGLGIRFILSWVLFRAEYVVAWILIGLAVCCTLANDANILFGSSYDAGWNALFVSPELLILGIPALICRLKRLSAVRSTLVAIYAAFTANGVLCLLAFASDRDIGWYVMLGIACLMVAEMCRLMFSAGSTVTLKQPATIGRL
jgi:F0F1-type ATP synthase membrane subunit c/vacuolar-type H+-ATPase subunit K